VAQTVDAARSARDPLPGVTERAAGVLPLLPLVLPMACWLWLAWRGGGYTIDEWGMWAVVSALAIAIILVAIGPPRLSWLTWVSPAALVALALLAWLSISWAAWPQNALVEGDRSLFYACVLVVCLLALGRVDGRRVAAGLVVAGVGVISLIEAWALWRMGDVSAFSFGRLVGGIGYGGGMAALVAVGVWPATAFAADRATTIALRAGSGVAAGAAAALVVPTGSRAALVALVASGLVFGALCPTPVRCAVIAVPVLAVIAFRWNDLNSAFAIAAGETQVRAAGSAIMLAALVGGAAALAQSLLDRKVTLGAQSRRLVTGGAAALVATVAVLTLVAFVAATDGKPGAWLDDKWQQFQVQDSPYRGGSDSRFGSVGTGRYDLWRVSVRLFREHPVDGVGAGNFLYDYAKDGRSEDQPFHAHSQVLEDASTLGVLGLLALVVALGLPIAAAVRARFRGATTAERLLAAGLAGGLAEFVLHASVDWIWQLAACVMPALILAAAALASLPRPPGEPAPPPEGARRLAMVGAAAGLLLVVGVAVLPATLAQAYLLRSYGQPEQQAIESAQSADTLDWLSSRPQVAIARATLRNGDARAALDASRLAVDREPGFWVAWQMLYLSAQRVGDTELAQEAQRHARALNPSLRTDFRFTEPPPSYDHY
jgi:hypothetical protein